MIHRREFFALAASAANAEWRNRQSGMTYRKLGRTNFMVSEIVMGGNAISPTKWEHILAALDMGLNYLDTAPAYGRGASEAGYAKVIKARPRDSFFLNSKVSLFGGNRSKLYRDIFESLSSSDQARIRKAARQEVERRQADAPDYFVGYFQGQESQLEWAPIANVMEREYGGKIDREKNYKRLVLESVDQSLSRLGTDHLDLLTCPHGANTPHEVTGYPEMFEAFEQLKKAGKVRHLSVSAHTDPAGVLEAAVKTGVYSAAMIAYNIVNHRYVDAAIEKAKQNDVGVISMKTARPVFSGRESRPEKPEHARLIEEAVPGPWKRPQKAYLWNLRNKNLSAVISEMMDLAMVKDNVPLAGQKG